MNTTIPFPEKNEYPAYAEMYMKWVRKDGSLLEQLRENFEKMKTRIASLSETALHFRYSPDKWSIKEVLVHIIDDERIYGYRALAFARNDKTILPGFEQDDYIAYSDAHTRLIENIMEEYEAVRMSTLALFKGFSEMALLRIGTANGNSTSVRALGYHIAGHELHHINSIETKYLNAMGLP
ncbi:MAG: DinB family protein [Bacteroidota bacterium]